MYVFAVTCKLKAIFRCGISFLESTFCWFRLYSLLKRWSKNLNFNNNPPSSFVTAGTTWKIEKQTLLVVNIVKAAYRPTAIKLYVFTYYSCVLCITNSINSLDKELLREFDVSPLTPNLSSLLYFWQLMFLLRFAKESNIFCWHYVPQEVMKNLACL